MKDSAPTPDGTGGWKNPNHSYEPSRSSDGAEGKQPDFKLLLAELTLRSNLALPTDEQEEKWFDAGYDVTNPDHDDFFDRLYTALGIGQTEHLDLPFSKKKSQSSTVAGLGKTQEVGSVIGRVRNLF